MVGPYGDVSGWQDHRSGVRGIDALASVKVKRRVVWRSADRDVIVQDRVHRTERSQRCQEDARRQQGLLDVI